MQEEGGGVAAIRAEAGMYWKRGGICLFKSWTLVRLRGSGG